MTRTTRAIEVGAGTGLLGLSLAGDVGEIVLAEPSVGMLDVIREKLAVGATPNASALAFDLLVDQPPRKRFDLVLSLLVLHHLPDTRRALAAMRRLLRRGGRIAVADLDLEDGSFHGGERAGVYHLGFDRVAVAELARSEGFTSVEVHTATEVVRGTQRYPLFLLVARRT